MRRAARWLPALLPTLLPTLLAACSRHEAPAPAAPAAAAVTVPVSAAPAPAKAMSVPQPAASLEGQKALVDELMQALFGDRYEAARGNAVIEMDDGEGKGNTGLYAVRAVALTHLDDGRTVLVANASDSNEAGEDLSAHATSGVLNVYLLTRGSGGPWTVLERHERVDALGSHGSIGSVAWAMVGPGRPGFVVSSGGTWQGQTILDASVYDLADGARSLGGYSEHSDNGGACMPETKDCWDVDGAARFVAREGGAPSPYWDIVVDYTGKHYTISETVDDKETEHLKSTIKQTARYRFDGKVYKLVAGSDPVQGI